jgi:hypothetical protein
MHPEISRRYGEQHRAECTGRRSGGAWPRGRAGRGQPAWPWSGPRGRWWPGECRRRGAVAVTARARRRPRRLAGPDAFGFRTYLTADEARQLAADWAAMLARFGDRAQDPSRRPEGAAPFEVLGRQVPDLVDAGRGLPGPARPGPAG